MIVHRMSNTRFYRTWASIKRRCTNPTQDNYKDYGAKGITFCYRWGNFVCFKEDMYESYLAHVKIHGETNTTIERFDPKGNYEPSNCRWATLSEQARNRRTSKMLTYKGVTKSMPDWAEEFNLTYDQLKLRLKRGWSLEKALVTGRLVNQYY